MKIALFSSRSQVVSEENKNLTKEISRYLCEKGITLLTGGCSGIPAIAIETAFECGGETAGYFPVKDRKEYFDRQHDGNIHHIDFYSSVHFAPGLSARSLEMIKDADAAIILSGRMGALSEFAMAVEERLPMAVIEGTGGVADELRTITTNIKREFPNNEVIFEKESITPQQSCEVWNAPPRLRIDSVGHDRGADRCFLGF